MPDNHTINNKRIAIIGAGIGGITSAKILRDITGRQYDIVIFEKESEVGGVWAASRRYPGIKTQNNRSTYQLIDFPYPKGTPEWPSGEQVQNYLSSYCTHFHLNGMIRFNTIVESAVLNANENNKTWTLVSTNIKTGFSQTETFDFLIIANGLFNVPYVPKYQGVDEFIKSGGKITHTSNFHNVSDVNDKNVIVVGYGKSACDVATSIVNTAASTTIIARNINWKIPPYINNMVNTKYLLLSRFGMALFPYGSSVTGVHKFLHGIGKLIPWFMLNSMARAIAKQFKLHEIGLYPKHTPIEKVADGSVNLAPNGFYEAIQNKTLLVEGPGVEITRVEANGTVHLSSGKAIHHVDHIICGTGFQQTLPFLESSIIKKFTDDDGNFRLYQNILPLDVPNLAFIGYSGNIFGSLMMELSAAWLGAYLTNQFALPSRNECIDRINNRFTLMEKYSKNHVRGTFIAAFSTYFIDELLEEMKCDISPLARFIEWLVIVDPQNYSAVIRNINQRANRCMELDEKEISSSFTSGNLNRIFISASAVAIFGIIAGFMISALGRYF